jgi:hypothetical protein
MKNASRKRGMEIQSNPDIPLLSFKIQKCILQDLAPVPAETQEWLPGFTGPVPPPLFIRDFHIQLIHILNPYKKIVNKFLNNW